MNFHFKIGNFWFHSFAIFKFLIHLILSQVIYLESDFVLPVIKNRTKKQILRIRGT